MLVIVHAFCVISHAFKKGSPGLRHKGCVLQHVSLGTLGDVTVVPGMRQSNVGGSHHASNRSTGVRTLWGLSRDCNKNQHFKTFCYAVVAYIILKTNLCSISCFYQLWKEMFEPIHCLNFGIGGDATQHVLWRLHNGELETIKPKVSGFVCLLACWPRIHTHHVQDRAHTIFHIPCITGYTSKIHQGIPESLQVDITAHFMNSPSSTKTPSITCQIP